MKLVIMTWRKPDDSSNDNAGANDNTNEKIMMMVEVT